MCQEHLENLLKRFTISSFDFFVSEEFHVEISSISPSFFFFFSLSFHSSACDERGVEVNCKRESSRCCVMARRESFPWPVAPAHRGPRRWPEIIILNGTIPSRSAASVLPAPLFIRQPVQPRRFCPVQHVLCFGSDPGFFFLIYGLNKKKKKKKKNHPHGVLLVLGISLPKAWRRKSWM